MGSFTKFFERGAKDFDTNVHDLGAVKACNDLDQLIKEVADS